MIGTLNNSRRNFWIDVDLETGRYYRYLFKREFGIKLQKPSNGDHITIACGLSNVDISYISLLKYKIVEFDILPTVYTNTNAFWFDVRCDYAESFREIYNIEEVPLHYCFGYKENGKIKETYYEN